MSKNRYLLCTGENCPIKERCALFYFHYDDVLDKTQTPHFAVAPYKHDRTNPYKSTGEKCGFYVKWDLYGIAPNDINSIE